MTKTGTLSSARAAAARWTRQHPPSGRTPRPASPPTLLPIPVGQEFPSLPDGTRVYPRPVTPETFEVEFVAYNDFRAACGVPPVTRARFQQTVERHNRTIAAKSPEDRAAWDSMLAEAEEFNA